MYAGSSAGSIILMDTIEHFAPVDDPTKAPRICKGLGVIKEAVIPHADHEDYKEQMAAIANTYRADGLDVISLNDDQVYLIDGDSSKII